jgi:hypothetical protein
MGEHTGGGGRRDPGGPGRVSIDRRSYLKVAGATAGSLSLLAGRGAAEPAAERHGIRFEHVVNMVEDAGCDPTGEEPCDEQLERAAADRTLLVFPEGEYRFTERTVLLDHANLGLLGRGDASFVVPERFNDKLLTIDRGTGLLFENITIDLTAKGATPGLHLAVEDDLEIHDIEFRGQGIHPDSQPQTCGNTARSGCNENPDVFNALYPIVRSPDGTGRLQNVVAHNAGLMGAYTRGGVWIGTSMKGTLTLKNCVFSGFPGNGVYASRTNGTVRIEGGTYANNDVSQVRIGSDGSYVRGATIAVDAATSNSPNPEDALNQRGVRFEAAKVESGWPAVRDCDVTIAATPHADGGVVANGTTGEFLVANTRIRVDVGGVRGVLAKRPNGGPNYDPPPEPHGGRLRGVSITGNAPAVGGDRTDSVVELRERPSSVIESCCIRQPSDGRNGVFLLGGDGYTIRDTTIDVGGQPIVRDGATVRTSGNRTAGSCPAPDPVGIGPSHTLTIASNGGRSTYRFEVDADLFLRTVENDATVDPNDVISGTTATGQVGKGGHDSYVFGGELRSIDVDGDATVTLDGGPVEAAGVDGPSAVGSFQNAPRDLDDDGAYEDVNGDGSGDVIDVQALFVNRDGAAVQDDATAFDFNGDGRADVVDVQALFGTLLG